MTPHVSISVAMCTYNGERHLCEQLQSIAKQSMLPSELVVCDDGSVDSTPDIVADFARSAPFNVRFTRNSKNLGTTKNFEQAIEICGGELIALCDQDDVWYPNKLAHLSRVLTSDPSIGGVFSDADLIDERSRLIGKQLWRVFGFTAKYQRKFTHDDPTSVLYKREIVTGATLMVRAGLRHTLLPVPNSWLHDGWFAWMLVLESRLVFANERLIGYRVHSNQQAGVPAVNFLDRMCRTRDIESRACKQMARQFEDLKLYLEKSPAKPSMATIEELQGVIRHYHARADLGSSFLVRAEYILSNVSAYYRYSNGCRTMIKDIVLR